jgi:hypothetical protein
MEGVVMADAILLADLNCLNFRQARAFFQCELRGKSLHFRRSFEIRQVI